MKFLNNYRTNSELTKTPVKVEEEKGPLYAAEKYLS